MNAPYVPFYTSDFLAGTSGMTAATKGVYITLLCLIYEAEAPLPQQWDTLARRCGCTLPAFKKAIQAMVDDGKIDVLDEGIWSQKVEKHIARRGDRRSSAKAAAKTRWKKTQQKQGKADATASDPQCQPEPEPKVKEDTNVSSKKRATRLPRDWVLPREWGEWALSEGWPEEVVRVEAEKFRDYWIGVGGQKGTKLDWQATWRNWIRNSKAPRVVQGGQNGNRNHGTDRLQRIVSAAAGGTSRQDWG